MNYVGIGHHRQYSQVTVIDQRGQVLRSGRVPNLQSEMGRFLAGLEGLEAVFEAGRSSSTMVDVLEEMGMGVKIAHPHEVKAIARAQTSFRREALLRKSSKRMGWAIQDLNR